MENLTEQDVEIMFEALDAWLNRDQSGRILGSLLEGMFIKKDNPDGMDEWRAKQEEEARVAEAKKKREAFQVVLLKAKLLRIVGAAEVASIAADLRQ